MNALLRLSNDKSSLLRVGALAVGVYVLLFALVSLQLGGSNDVPSSDSALGVVGWTKALEPSLAGNTLEQIRNGSNPAQADLRTVVVPQVIERQTLVVPSPQGPLPRTTPTSSAARGADNGPQLPMVRITQISPDTPRVGRTTQVRFQGGDQDGIVRAVAVDWGDGNTDWTYLPDRCTATASEPEHSFAPADHTYDQVGTYQITVSLFSAGSCERGAIQFGTDQTQIEVSVYLPAAPSLR